MLPLTVGIIGLVVGWSAHRRLSRGILHDTDDVRAPANGTVWMVPTSGVLAAALTMAQLDRPAFAITCGLVWLVMVPLIAVDLEAKRLPDRLNFGALVISLVGLASWGVTSGDWDAIGRAVLAAIAVTAFHLVLAVFTGGRGMGLGDVKLVPTLGLLLGALSWTHLIAGILAGYLLALAITLGGAMVRGRRPDKEIPFGPYLIAGTGLILLAPLWGLIR